MNIARYGKNICPCCGIRERKAGRAYCPECNKTKNREYNRRLREKKLPKFQALLAEAQGCREALEHLRENGQIQ